MSEGDALLEDGGLYRLEPTDDHGRLEPGVYAVGGEHGGIALLVVVSDPIDADLAGQEISEHAAEVQTGAPVDLPNHGALTFEHRVPFLAVWPRRRLEVVQ